MKKASISTIGLLVLCAVAALAQTGPAVQTIQQPEANQQARIAQGVHSGQLTAHENANVERRESSINHEEHNMRAPATDY